MPWYKTASTLPLSNVKLRYGSYDHQDRFVQQHPELVATVGAQILHAPGLYAGTFQVNYTESPTLPTYSQDTYSQLRQLETEITH